MCRYRRDQGQWEKIPEIHYNQESKCYESHPLFKGEIWCISEELFDDCVKTYMEQYHVTRTYAIVLALSLENWLMEDNRIFFRV